jgi:hypothetical protein
MPDEIWEIFRDVRMLMKVEKEPVANMQRTAAAEIIGVPFVPRILHEQSLYLYHILRVQDLTHPDQSAMVFCHDFPQNALQTRCLWLTSCLLTRSGDNPHATVA